MQNCLPISLSMGMVKWQSLYSPRVGPQNDVSRVNEFISWNSFHITTRPVDSFCFYIWKLQLSKWKRSVFLWNSKGKIRSFKRSCGNVERISTDKFIHSRDVILWSNSRAVQGLPLYHSNTPWHGQIILHYSTWLCKQWAKSERGYIGAWSNVSSAKCRRRTQLIISTDR
jgi:hypothetical protein